MHCTLVYWKEKLLIKIITKINHMHSCACLSSILFQYLVAGPRSYGNIYMFTYFLYKTQSFIVTNWDFCAVKSFQKDTWGPSLKIFALRMRLRKVCERSLSQTRCNCVRCREQFASQPHIAFAVRMFRSCTWGGWGGYIHLYVDRELDLVYQKVSLMVYVSMHLHDVYISIEFGSTRTIYQG